jgi:hypothetical protein
LHKLIWTESLENFSFAKDCKSITKCIC